MEIFQTDAFYQNRSLFTKNKFSQQKLMMFMQLTIIAAYYSECSCVN